MSINNSNRVVYDETFLQDMFNDIPYDSRADNFTKLLMVVGNRFDKVNKAAISLAYSRLLDNASGQMLENIASRFFIERLGKTDEELKATIKLRAVSQDSEATRRDIFNILSIISGEGGYVHIYKGVDNYLQVTISTDCLDLTKVKIDLENLFPVNTNLTFLKTNVVRKGFGVGSVLKPSINSPKIGTLGTVTDVNSDNNYAAVTIINNERGR